MNRAIQTHLEVVRVKQASGDKYFASLMLEKELYNKVLDSYARSKHFLTDDLKPSGLKIADQTASKVFGINGKLHYVKNHLEAVIMMLSAMFTPDHKLFITYDDHDPAWDHERQRDLQIIIKQLTELFVSSIIELIRLNEDQESQHREILEAMTRFSCGAMSIKNVSSDLLRKALQNMATIAALNPYSAASAMRLR